MSKTDFERVHRYNAINVAVNWEDSIELRAEDSSDVVYVQMSTEEAKELRKQLKNIINEKEAN